MYVYTLVIILSLTIVISVPAFAVGQFLGGGQSKAVDAFLSYDEPIQRSTSLPLNTDTTTVTIIYHPKASCLFFSAELNRVDITNQFDCSAAKNGGDGSESVEIDIDNGRNVLKLSIRGLLDSGRAATDTDRLTFVVK